MVSVLVSPLTRLDEWREQAVRFSLQSVPLKTVPLRLRPVVICALAVWFLLLGVLGIVPNQGVPINDKVMHFFGMGTATFLIYFLLEVPESSRRVWFYQRAPLIVTLFFGFFCGGTLSEVAQGYLPWKQFDAYDIYANLAGCTLGFLLANHLTRRARKRYEISRLYRPINPNAPAYRPMTASRAGEYTDDVLISPIIRSSAYSSRPGAPRSGSFSEGEDAWDDDAASVRSGRYAGSLSDAEAGGERRADVFRLDDDDEEGEGKASGA